MPFGATPATPASSQTGHFPQNDRHLVGGACLDPSLACKMEHGKMPHFAE